MSAPHKTQTPSHIRIMELQSLVLGDPDSPKLHMNPDLCRTTAEPEPGTIEKCFKTFECTSVFLVLVVSEYKAFLQTDVYGVSAKVSASTLTGMFAVCDSIKTQIYSHEKCMIVNRKRRLLSKENKCFCV